MSNGDLFNLMDVTMKQLLETFPDPRKPGADETPPRNYRCGKCGRWVEARHDCE